MSHVACPGNQNHVCLLTCFLSGARKSNGIVPTGIGHVANIAVCVGTRHISAASCKRCEPCLVCFELEQRGNF